MAKTNIAGMSCVDAFVSSDEEAALVAFVDSARWQTDLKRRVQHYGYRYDYKARNVSPADYLGVIPEPLYSLGQRLSTAGLLDVLPDQVIVNEYLPGQGISAHIDCEPCFGPQIASISLSGSCMMTFSKPGKNEKIEISLKRRSLLLLEGDARYKWQHSIPARKSDIIAGVRVPRSRRISLTFRKVSMGPSALGPR